ncbi:VTT domain-containing protein [Streptococcus zalophi]|uniref:TVP38/TMEM64 family membrane protein n=1 Tax=Streptococcus zalophi TaxID=640031 RepID=A0A934UD68_9STRE|nr:VTT domain-containing protein [Streptococcus zalophi]MBJ8349368.1 TVP38/TMEM64 family protein [Streptococcus zalophi]MCR8967437.1 VTT domain-containing protein [Streptococcus zalophi]
MSKLTRRQEKYEKLKKFFHVLGIISIILSIGLVIYLVKGLDILNNPDALAQMIKEHLFWGSILFFIIQIVQVIIPIIPGGVTTVVGFIAFGPIVGFILNYIGIIIGSIILFTITRTYGRKFILLFTKEKQLNYYEEKLSSPTYEYFFILNMLSPVSPADVLVMVTGLTKMSYRKFITIILITKPFSIVAYSYFWIYGGHLFKDFF